MSLRSAGPSRTRRNYRVTAERGGKSEGNDQKTYAKGRQDGRMTPDQQCVIVILKDRLTRMLLVLAL